MGVLRSTQTNFRKQTEGKNKGETLLVQNVVSRLCNSSRLYSDYTSYLVHRAHAYLIRGNAPDLVDTSDCVRPLIDVQTNPPTDQPYIGVQTDPPMI